MLGVHNVYTISEVPSKNLDIHEEANDFGWNLGNE